MRSEGLWCFHPLRHRGGGAFALWRTCLPGEAEALRYRLAPFFQQLRAVLRLSPARSAGVGPRFPDSRFINNKFWVPLPRQVPGGHAQLDMSDFTGV